MKLKTNKLYIIDFISILFFTALTSGQAFATAGPPLLTDDPETPGSNRWEINVAVTSEVNHEESRLEAPIADINYGVGKNVQLKYEIPWVVLGHNDETNGPQTGFDRSIAGIKWRFLNEESLGFSMSAYPQYTFAPPVSGKLTNEITASEPQAEAFLPIEIQEKRGAFDFNQEFGFKRVSGNENQFAAGLSSSYTIKDGFLALAELHSDIKAQFNDSEIVANGGALYEVGEHLSLLGSVGHSLKTMDGESGKVLAYTGLQFHM